MTPDPYYNPDCDLFLGIDKGFRNPNVTLWIQPDRKMGAGDRPLRPLPGAQDPGRERQDSLGDS